MFKPSTKFLIVDDHLTMRLIIRKTLSELGYENTIEAADGLIALNILNQHAQTSEPVEFIISDWNMPNMQGIDFLKKCRADKIFEKIPFVLITAEDDQAKIIDAVTAGVTDYIIKPFSPAMLKSKFETYYKKLNLSNSAARSA